MHPIRLGIVVGGLLAVIVAVGQTNAALAPTIDLNDGPADLTVQGAVAQGRLGSSVATGDVNGDGLDDLILGAPSTASDAGAAYVVYGSTDLPPTIDLAGTAADVAILGAAEGDRLGHAVTAGDLNGDGADDIVVAAYRAAAASGPATGKTYVMLGGDSLASVVDLGDTNADVTIIGAAEGDQFGYAVAPGDVNGDAIDDLVIGAFTANRNGIGDVGVVHVIHGRPDLAGEVDLSASDADVTIIGGDAGDHVGSTVAAGDVNGDGADDVIIGAPDADPAGGAVAGETYVVFGGGDLPPIINLSDSPADVTIGGAGGNDRLGSALAADDVNGDGFADVISSAPNAGVPGRDLAGKTYVLYGSPSLPPSIDLASAEVDLAVLGVDEGDHAGISVAAGDVSGDGVADLIIGAYFADPAGGVGAGETYVLFGGPALPADVDLQVTPADVTVFGDDEFDFSGWAVAAGDLNGDSADDLVVGALTAGPLGRMNAGVAYVIYGEGQATPTATGTPTLASPTPTPTATAQGLLGDANADGTVTSIDAVLILQLVAGLIPSLLGGALADASLDGAVSAVDATLVLQAVAGLIVLAS